MIKHFLLLFVFVLFFVSACSLQKIEDVKKDSSVVVSDDSSQLANPASVHCVEHGGKVDIRTEADGGQYGVCVFSDSSECEEWKFFRGECEIKK